MKNLYTLFFLTVFLLAPALAHAQSPAMQIVFKDDFTDNRHNWKQFIRHRDVFSIVRDGSLIFEHRRRIGAWTIAKQIDLNPKYDFEIEATITKVRGVNNYGYGLSWGNRDSQNHYVFLISGDGNVQVGKAAGGRYTQLIRWKHASTINKWNGRNKLEIKKYGRNLRFYVNGTMVGKTPFQPFFGKNIGFFINKNMRIKVEDFVIHSKSPYSGGYVHNNLPDENTHQSYPPDLVVEDIKFNDPSNNGVLETNESGEITFKLVNRGRGEAKNIRVKLTALSNADALQLGSQTVYSLDAKSYRNVSIPIKAKKDLSNKDCRVKVEIVEANGFDATPVVLNFESRQAPKPDLQIKQIAINDKESPDGKGDAYGNGNSTIEPGESIEVTAYVQNFGKAQARNVSATVKLTSTDPNLTFPDGGKVYDLGNIERGDYRKIEFYFYTSRRYDQSEIPLVVELRHNAAATPETQALGLKTGVRTQNIVDVHLTQLEDKEDEIHIRPIQDIIDPSDVDLNIPESRYNGSNTLCVIIGIEKYKYAPDVSYASHDAQIFYKYAQTTFGIPQENIYSRINDGATSGEFHKVFSKDGWLSRRIKEGETNILVYFAGHGAPDLNSKNAFLIPYDVDPNYASTGFSLEKMYASLSAMEANSVTVFLDACFSGISRSNEMLIADARGIIVKPKKASLFGDNLIVISASEAEQFSSAYPEKYHGLFTYFLLKGIRGQAKGNDNELRIDELYQYLKENVSTRAAYMDREQTPTLEGKQQDRVLLRY